MRYIISSRMNSSLLRPGQALAVACLSLACLPSVALAEVPKVVTDVPPVHSLVSLVMGDLGTPELLLEPGASEHHFQLRPSQAVGLSSADLVVMMGPELTPWIETPLTLRPEGAPVLGLLKVAGTHLREYAEEDHGHEGHEHEAHEAGHDHEGHDHEGHDHSGHDHAGHDHEAQSHDHSGEDHGHSHDGVDPHAWLDPENARIWLPVIAAELARLDPENAATYAANAKAAQDRIAAADTEASALLRGVAQRPFVTFHDAYGYYVSHYGLALAGAVSAGDASTPGARHLTELKARVEAGEVVCLFPEAGQDPALALRVAENTGVKIGAALDPVGTAMEPGPELYTTLLVATATTLAACLSE